MKKILFETLDKIIDSFILPTEKKISYDYIFKTIILYTLYSLINNIF